MFYNIGSYFGEDNCIFVYDDTDGSVELIEEAKLAESGIQLGYSYPDYMEIHVLKPKLRMLGFTKYNDDVDTLMRGIAEYRINVVEVYLRLNLAFYMSGSNVVATVTMLCNYNAFKLREKKLITNRFCVQGFGVGLSIRIPLRMVIWLLNLCGRYDFDGIMNAFDGFFGERLCELVEMDSSEVQFGSWL